MGQDARVRYTQMVIREKFLFLLKQKPLNKITVKEICSLAEINRATFYRYYNDPYDLMNQIERAILAELHDIVQNSIGDGLKRTLIRMLKKIKEDGELYITLFSENGDPSFGVKIFQMCYKDFSSYIKVQLPHLSNAQQVWLYIYAAQGSSGILNYWMTTGMTAPPDEIADFIEHLISSTMRIEP